MICLTGDVHHTSLMINDQKYISDQNLTEIRIARLYVQLLEKYDVKSTLYVCGRAFTEECSDLETVATHPLVEVGGHMFNARFPRECFDAYGEQTGLWNGPRWYQAWDIRQNVEVVRAAMGYDLISWRSHSYKVDCNTYELLAANGIRVVSDAMSATNLRPERTAAGLISHPINTVPDHDHLYHAHRTKDYVEAANQRGYGADEFGAVSYTIEEWGKLVMQQIDSIEEKGGIATILAHPLCMYLADEFRTLTMLLENISSRQHIWAREILEVGNTP